MERRIIDTDEPFNDGSHIIYVNGEDKNSSTALGKLMHDFFCTNPNDMYYDALAEKARYFKEDEKGVETMCDVLEEMRIEVAKETAIQIKTESIFRMMQIGMSIENIAFVENLPVEQVESIVALQSM